ncbi:chemotaxis protein CheB [Hephaestia mangrovi]|uniref:chemotaxis protein CheB n=1 Tax=Hephaestia mangrovi TaxID=2873268 RepID=UPI002106B245|nr:chemotaxis protein CheB [Hephaestia mangrovi]
MAVMPDQHVRPDWAGPVARILIVDDSVVARAVIARMIDQGRGYEVAAAVSDVHMALAFLAQEKVDVILLDIELPGIDGLTALPDIIAAGGGAKVLVVSSACDEGAAVTVQALALGAVDTLVKPNNGSMIGGFATSLERKLQRLTQSGEPAPQPQRQAPSLAAGDEFDIVAIGASTGGIHALSHVLRALPPSFQVPILITQHLPESFMPYFAAQVAILAGRPCDVATDHMRIRPGRAILAPGDAHLRCTRLAEGGAALRLLRTPASSGCMPSVDPMLASAAEIFGARTLAIMLSGMGRDGAEGAAKVAAAGGCVIVQDQASSVIWGMPGAVARAGNASAILPPDEIGRVVAAQRRPA